MPATQLVFYQDENGRAPVVDWLKDIRGQQRKGYANCVARLEQLAARGHELRRPVADYLRDGIYELRAKLSHTQYRILYFFHGRNTVVLIHAMIKAGAAVPNSDMERALRRKGRYERDVEGHTYIGGI
jgi:phage-related protein